MSLTVLMKAGYDVKFKVGSKRDASDGGSLFTADGKEIALVFEDNMWRLLMWDKPTRQHCVQGMTVHSTAFAALPFHGNEMSPMSVQDARDVISRRHRRLCVRSTSPQRQQRWMHVTATLEML